MSKYQVPAAFGHHLRQFALSADFLSVTHYQRIQRAIADFLFDQLQAVTVGLFEPCEIDDTDGLRLVWSNPTFHVHETLKDENGYRRQLAFALGERRNLWVVSDNDNPLTEKNRGVDLWYERSENLPPFFSSHDHPRTKTQVIFVVKNAHNRVNGVFLIEMSQKVLPTPALRSDLSTIADAVGLLKGLDSTTQEQQHSTRMAIRELERIKNRTHLETGARPALFFAYSAKSPRDVVKAIISVLEEFKDHVAVRDWSAMHDPGDINVQVTEEILNARYGICYFSEEVQSVGPAPTQSNEKSFQDNPNVLMEAGMLHMVTEGAGGVGTGWIPVREEVSPDVPFDIVSQRTIIVRRTKAGGLRKKAFREDLKKKLAALITVPVPGKEISDSL